MTHLLVSCAPFHLKRLLQRNFPESATVTGRVTYYQRTEYSLQRYNNKQRGTLWARLTHLTLDLDRKVISWPYALFKELAALEQLTSSVLNRVTA